MLETPETFFFMGGPLQPYSPKSDFEPFKQKLDAALQMIEGTTAGQTLLKDIRQSNTKVSIHQIKVHGCNYFIEKSQSDAACYREVLKDEDLYTLLSKLANDPKTTTSAGLMHACRKLKVTITKGDVPTFKSDLLGRGKAAYWIMEHLKPGSGADAVVKWNCDEQTIWSSSMGPAPAWSTRPPWVALAHELIHAWRSATGRRVFHPTTTTYYEEAMTVGLAPYDGCEVTENKLRELKGEPRRSYYGPPDVEKSKKAEEKYAKA